MRLVAFLFGLLWAVAQAQTLPVTVVSSQINASFTATRYSGVAPLAVMFDAGGTSDPTDTTNPWHELEDRWDFGDPNTTAAGTCGLQVQPGEGYWRCGSNPGGNSKDAAMGPIAAHVFECSNGGTCTFNVCMTARYSTTLSPAVCQTITATDPNFYFAGSKTICVSTSGTFTAAPCNSVGVIQVTSSNAVTAISGHIGSGGVRILFRRGETFAVGSAISVSQAGPVIIGAYDTGANPVMNLTYNGDLFNMGLHTLGVNGVSDWRFVDLYCEGNNESLADCYQGQATFNNFLILRAYCHTVYRCVDTSADTLDQYNSPGNITNPIFTGLFIVDEVVDTLYSGNVNGPEGNYVAANNLAIMGEFANTGGFTEHGTRIEYANPAVVSNGTITGIASGKAFLTIRAQPQPSNTLGPNFYTQNLVIGDNYWYGGATSGISSSSAINQSENGRCNQEIWERNLFIGSATTTAALSISCTNVTVRNSIFNLLGTSGAQAFISPSFNWISSSAENPGNQPTNIWLYNNTMLSAATGNSNVFMSSFTGNVVNLTSSVYTYNNNLVYAPSTGTGPVMFQNLTGVTITQSGNTSNAQIKTSPAFGSTASTPPLSATDFKPTGSSYAIGGGVAVPVWSDFFGNLRNGNNMGAVNP